MLIDTGKKALVKLPRLLLGYRWRIGDIYQYKDLTLILHRDWANDQQYRIYQWTETIMGSMIGITKNLYYESAFPTKERATFLMNEYLEKYYDKVIDILKFWTKVEPYAYPFPEQLPVRIEYDE